jgi:hypothetical protein
LVHIKHPQVEELYHKHRHSTIIMLLEKEKKFFTLNLSKSDGSTSI